MDQNTEDRSARPSSWKPLVLAVVLPGLGMLAELQLRMFQGIAFDPFATPWQIAACVVGLLVAAVLVATTTRGETRALGAQVFALGAALGVAGIYALAFLPALPVIVFAFVLGLGVLAAAPYWSLFGLWLLGSRLRRTWDRENRPPRAFWVALLLGAGPVSGLLIADELRLHHVHRSIVAATGDIPEERAEGLAQLRRWAREEELLKTCYGGPWGLRAGMAWWSHRRSFWGDRNWLREAGLPDREACRRLFYRVTGRSFSELPVPREYAEWAALDDAAASDAAVGPVPGLHLASSTQRVLPEPAAGFAQVDWVIEVRNDGHLARQARLHVDLPPGAFAHHLSLWIDGRERHAAVDRETVAVSAYRSVTRRRRDPALLREVAPGRLRLLVFPVPPEGVQRVRIGVTAPLLFDGAAGRLCLPALAETNCEWPRRLRQLVEVPEENGPRRLRLSSADARRPRERALAFAPPATGGTFWSRDGDGISVLELARRRPEPWPGQRHLVLVMDGGASAAGLAGANTLVAFPPGTPCTLIHAGDSISRTSGTTGSAEVRAWLGRRRFVGGIDAGPALREAVELAASLEDARVVWLHGGQPLFLAEPGPLLRACERAGVEIVSVALDPRPNVLRNRLAREGHARALARLGVLEADLERLHGHGAEGECLGDLLVRSWRRMEGREAEAPEGEEVSNALSRLWARAEVDRMLALGESSSASMVAERFRIVAPGTAAVVLETAAQYSQFGLDPDRDAAVTPGAGNPVPELSTWLLLGSGLFALFLLRRRHDESGSRCPNGLPT